MPADQEALRLSMLPAATILDMTSLEVKGRQVEVRTNGGIVRISTAVTPFSGQEAVVVEVEPNTWYRTRTDAGGNWRAEVRDLGSSQERTEVILRREEGS